MSSNLARRIAVAAVGIPAAVAFVWVGGWVLAALIALFGVAGAHEFYQMAERRGVRPLRAIGYVGAVLPALATFAVLPAGGGLPVKWVVWCAAVWIIGVALVNTLRRPPEQQPLAAAAVTVFGAAYAGALPAFLLALRHATPDITAWAGTALVFLPLVVTWVGDTAAMAGGSAFHGPKMAPVLSPKKTWAGAVTGAIVAVVLAPVYGRLVLVRIGIDIPVWQLAIIGVVVSVAGQIGDVAESLYKREVGIKDSGTFFPGHGGVLDRFDSLYWALPATVILLGAFGVV